MRTSKCSKKRPKPSTAKFLDQENTFAIVWGNPRRKSCPKIESSQMRTPNEKRVHARPPKAQYSEFLAHSRYMLNRTHTQTNLRT